MNPRFFTCALLLAGHSWVQAAPPLAPRPEALVPAGFVVQQTLQGDLNKDGQDDVVLLIKATDKKQWAPNQFGQVVDKNRRGLVVAFQHQQQYQLVLLHKACFASENEDGGVYFAPELGLEIRKGNLLIHYHHGRYGYWEYNFRYQQGNFELIGYESSSNRGPTVLSDVSVNFLTRKVRTRHNTQPLAEDGEGQLKETWNRLPPQPLAKLQEIDDFESTQVFKAEQATPAPGK